jgi:hypothetical protein
VSHVFSHPYLSNFIFVVCHPALHFHWFKANWKDDDLQYAQDTFKSAYQEYLQSLPPPPPIVKPTIPASYDNDFLAVVAGFRGEEEVEVEEHLSPEDEHYENLGRVPLMINQPLVWWKVSYLFILFPFCG